MEKQFYKLSGACLFTGAMLMVLTMVLHPSGGSIEHILQIKKVIVLSHSMAIVSVPILAFGFYGLSLRLKTPSKLSYLAFSFVIFGLFAAMIAGTINGLTLPLFLEKATENGMDVNTIKAINWYGRYINLPMDYILIGGLTAAIALWSIVMFRSAHFPRWLAIWGLSIAVLGGIAAVLGFNFASLLGFRVFVFGVAGWILITAACVFRVQGQSTPE